MIPIAALDDVLLGVYRGARGTTTHRGGPVLGAFRGTLPFFLPFAAFQAATADRGEVGQRVAGFTGGFVASTAAYGVVDHLVKTRLFPGRRALSAVGRMGRGRVAGGVAAFGLGIPAMAAATAAAWVVDDFVAPRIEKTWAMALNETRNLREIHAGGNYQDTATAYTMRQRAVQELSSSLLNARQWLGKESVLMHQ